MIKCQMPVKNYNDRRMQPLGNEVTQRNTNNSV